jgi:hypothetical protein
LTLVWSFAEATKFQRRARSTTVSIEESNKKLLPENIVITRYAYEMFGQKPDYVSHEFMNPRMKNWLIGARSMQVLDSNQNAARRGKPVQEFGLVRQPGRRDEYTLSPPLMLKPGIQYMLEFRFGGRNLLGELRLSGDRLDRTYKVKGSESGKFGSTVGHANSMTIWTSGNDHETVRFNYRPAGGEIPANLARVRVFEIDPKQLPVEVESMLPYRSTSRSTREAWLVTHRMFLPGYLAKVDNLPAEIRSSAEGLVMIKVPKGTAKVELRYEGPWPVKIALWVSGIAWFGLILVSTMFLIIRRMDRNTKSRLRSSSSPTVINPIDCFDSGGLRGTHSKQIEV